MFGMGTIILVAVLVLLFGTKKIPELARSIGEVARNIKDGFSGDEDKNNKNKTS